MKACLFSRDQNLQDRASVSACLTCASAQTDHRTHELAILMRGGTGCCARTTSTLASSADCTSPIARGEREEHPWRFTADWSGQSAEAVDGKRYAEKSRGTTETSSASKAKASATETGLYSGASIGDRQTTSPIGPWRSRRQIRWSSRPGRTR